MHLFSGDIGKAGVSYTHWCWVGNLLHAEVAAFAFSRLQPRRCRATEQDMSEQFPLCPICERPIKTEIRSQASPTQELRVPTVCGDRHGERSPAGGSFQD